MHEMYCCFKDITDQQNKFQLRLEIKQVAEVTQQVPALVEARVHGIEDVWELLKTGNLVISFGPTSANELCIRSHWYCIDSRSQPYYILIFSILNTLITGMKL